MTAPPVAAAPDLHDEVERQLRQNLLEVWFPRALDREHGGFLCDFDYEWKPSGRQPKTIVFQARCTWLASQAMLRYPDDPRYAEAARHGFKFLRDTMWDAENGGWYWHLDREGNVDAPWKGAKHAYGIGFGIYACSAYFLATKDAQGLELAKKGFEWLERHGHDDRNGGYHEYFLRDGTRILDDSLDPVGNGRDAIGTRIGWKSMNTHIHLLEALTALHGVWDEPRVTTRLTELLTVARDKLTAKPGAMHQFLNPDWTPVPDLDSYGHDVETGYLLMEAASAVGKDGDAATRAAAKSLLDHALDYGWDKQNGGFFEAGGTFGPVHDKRKVWWVQAEGLNSLLMFSRLYPDDPRGYRKLFEQQWEYVKKNCIDAEHGEWFGDALDAGGNRMASKASEWKAGYHAGRAMLNVSEWLRTP